MERHWLLWLWWLCAPFHGLAWANNAHTTDAGAVLVMASGTALPPEGLHPPEPEPPISLTTWLGVLEDPGKQLTLQDVSSAAVAARFRTGLAPGEALNLGYSPSAYWLRLVLRNDSPQAVQRLLEINHARLSHVELHSRDELGHTLSTHTGSALPFATRSLAHRTLVFPVTIHAHGQQTLHMRVESTNTILLPLRLWTAQAFQAHSTRDLGIQGLYFGIALAMLVFNLLLWVTLHDRMYGHYVLYVFCLVLAFATQTGLAQQYLWPQATHFSDVATGIWYSAALASLLLFFRIILDTRHTLPRWDKVLLGLAWLCVPCMLALYWAYSAVVAPIAVIHIVAMLTLVFTAIHQAWQRRRMAYYFLGAYAVFCLGALFLAVRSLGWIESGWIVTHALQIGSALEMVLLAFALADRLHVLHQEKMLAQTQAQSAQKALMHVMQDNQQTLQQQVAERTAALEQANRQLQALSDTDGLTGVANRRRFDAALATEWQRAQRQQQPLSVVMLDVDWFKHYNDHFGHQAGDECLRQLGRILLGAINRTGDLVARYGGEEFVFIAPHTGAAEAAVMAERVHQALAALNLAHPLSPLGRVTVSMGVACCVPASVNRPAATPVTPDEPARLIALADQALYAAKAAGRNRTITLP